MRICARTSSARASAPGTADLRSSRSRPATTSSCAASCGAGTWTGPRSCTARSRTSSEPTNSGRFRPAPPASPVEHADPVGLSRSCERTGPKGRPQRAFLLSHAFERPRSATIGTDSHHQGAVAVPPQKRVTRLVATAPAPCNASLEIPGTPHTRSLTSWVSDVALLASASRYGYTAIQSLIDLRLGLVDDGKQTQSPVESRGTLSSSSLLSRPKIKRIVYNIAALVIRRAFTAFSRNSFVSTRWYSSVLWSGPTGSVVE